MQKNQTQGRNDFLIDGFPRNKDNLDGWNRAMGEKVTLKMVLFFDCDDQVLTEYPCSNSPPRLKLVCCRMTCGNAAASLKVNAST